jgi:ubiquitin C-terminal hydrolase
MEPSEKALGCVGLANLGNTCFLNVIVQSVRYCPELTPYLLKNTYKLHLKESRKIAPIVEEFADVIKGMWDAGVRKNATMAPRGFISAAANLSDSAGYPNLVSGAQADAAEFLQFLLESIHNGIARQVQMDIVGKPKTSHDHTQIKALQSWAEFHRKEYSIVVENFFGQTQTITTCKGCGAVSPRFEPWMMLKVPISTEGTGPLSLQSCIDSAFEKETLEDYKCDRCGKQGPADLQGSISRLPATLIIVLKRFTNAGTKIRRRVDVDTNNTNLAKWISFPSVTKNITPVYSTFAIVEHHGGSRGGHYVSYAKHNDKWVNYDDTSMRAVSDTDLVNDDSYIFFMTRNPYSSPVPIVKDTSRE